MDEGFVITLNTYKDRTIMRRRVCEGTDLSGAHGLAYHTYNVLFEVIRRSYHTVIFTLWTGGAG